MNLHLFFFFDIINLILMGGDLSMEEIERGIKIFLKEINEASIDELNRIIVRESKTRRNNRKIENGKNVYVVPKEYVDMISRAVEQEKEKRQYNKKREDIKFEQDNKVAFEILEKKGRYDIDAFDESKNKRNIRRKPRRMKKNRFINKGLKLLSFIGVAGIAVATYGKAVEVIAKDINDYNNVKASVEGWTEEQIEAEAERLLKEEISEATGVDEDEISFSDEWQTYSTSSETYTVTVKAGEKEYHHTKAYRDFIDFNDIDNTLGGKVADLISKMKNAEGIEDKIKSLKNNKNFCDTYELKVVEDNKLIEEEEER